MDNTVVGVRVVAAYDFEASGDEGWTVAAPNNATRPGNWDSRGPDRDRRSAGERQLAEGRYPLLVHGPGFGGRGLGENDVDGGSARRSSPPFDLDGTASATLRYARWYSNDTGASPGADVFNVDLSDDGGVSWTSAEVVGPTGAGTTGGWVETSIDIGALVALTDQVRVRFVASDLGSGSIVEAAVDDVAGRGGRPGSGLSSARQLLRCPPTSGPRARSWPRAAPPTSP